MGYTYFALHISCFFGVTIFVTFFSIFHHLLFSAIPLIDLGMNENPGLILWGRLFQLRSYFCTAYTLFMHLHHTMDHFLASVVYFTTIHRHYYHRITGPSLKFNCLAPRHTELLYRYLSISLEDRKSVV